MSMVFCLRVRHWWIAWLINIQGFLSFNGHLARYVKLRVAHAPGMLSTPPQVSDPDMQHGTCVTHVLWCIPGSPTSSFLWIRWRGKHSLHCRRMPKPQFYVSGKRPMAHCSRIYSTSFFVNIDRYGSVKPATVPVLTDVIRMVVFIPNTSINDKPRHNCQLA